MADKKSVVAVLPNGTEHFEDINAFGNRGFSDHDYRTVCENAVRKAGLKTPRRNPANVKVELFALEIKQGKLERRKINTYGIQPPLEAMTTDEFNAEMNEIKGQLPKEFHNYIEGEAWDRGHSAGYEECVSIARSIAFSLKPAVDAYTTRIKRVG